MSRANTKDSKIDRLLLRQRGDRLDILEVLRLARETRIVQKLTVERLSNSLKLATETAHRLEAENSRLRKIRCAECGLFDGHVAGCPESKRKPGQPYRPSCSCAEGACRGYSYCRFAQLAPR